MSATPDSTLADPKQLISDLRRELAECKTERDECKTERDEALQRETATAEVLQVINSSPGDLAPVFDAMLERATRLCEAAAGTFWVFDGEQCRAAAIRGMPQSFVEVARGYGPGPQTPAMRIARGEQLIHIADLGTESVYRSGDPLVVAAVERAGIRTFLSVPLRKEDALLGVFSVYRREIRPFSDKQIALVQNFAAQAVIAMENARLITETREALEQQTATAEVLQVINSSPGDLAPVFDAILDKATGLCEAAFGTLRTYDGERFNLAASRGASPALLEFQRKPLTSGLGIRRFLQGENVHNVPDVIEGEAYRAGSAGQRALVELGGARSFLSVALRKEEALLGYMSFYRREVRPFTDKQIALLQNFAAQAVIAMENARLLIETREALEQQTDTAEVLQVINSSPGNLAPVWDAMLRKATELCEAPFGNMHTYAGERFHPAGSYGGVLLLWQSSWRMFHCNPDAKPDSVGSRAAPSSCISPILLTLAKPARATRDAWGYGARRDSDLRCRRPPEGGSVAGGDCRNIGRRCGRFPISRSHCCRISRPRRSSRWRMRGCSASCSSAPTTSRSCSNTRPQPATCWRSSAARPLTCNRYSIL